MDTTEETETLPEYVGRHIDKDLNGPHMYIYYDDECHEQDGNGWCVEFSEGSVTYRYPTLVDACNWITADPYCEKFMKVRVV